MSVLVHALREYSQLIRLAMFAILVGLGVCVMLARGQRRRGFIQLLIAYTLAVNFLVVFARLEAWPFSRYPMMAVPTGDPGAELSIIVFRAVDRDGREWQIDSRAWSPLYPQAVWDPLESTCRHASLSIL